MQKIAQRQKVLLTDTRRMDARIKKIGHIFSLMATVRQHGNGIKINGLTECMVALVLH